MKVYNTLSGKKEDFVPLHDKKVGMYVCGPTVYDFGHLGHGRSAVSFDVIRKFLIYSGYKVTYVTNFTDIDDKMINRAALMKISVADLADRIIPEYKKDYEALGIMAGDVEPKATENIAEMITLIEGLDKRGYTYVLDDGVYFDVRKFAAYGKLSKQNLDELKSGARVVLNEKKRNPQDFVLWKFAKEGEPQWESPWGSGRPGWHIECSAMSSKYLGQTFDIHGGGADLAFPHHECEIAQSEAFSGKEFAKYWIHNGFIQVNNEKMSKSLGNFFTLRDIFKTYDPQVVRFMFLQTHYRSPIEFSDSILSQSRNGLMRLHDFMRRLEDFKPGDVKGGQTEVEEMISSTEKRFREAMEDDFETPGALAALFDFVKGINKMIDAGNLSSESREKVMTFLMRLDFVFGLLQSTRDESVDSEVMELIEMRNKARKDKDWSKADELRKKLLVKGIIVEDGPAGTTWKKV
jgi:cysteinyl-tRNA synthetase